MIVDFPQSGKSEFSYSIISKIAITKQEERHNYLLGEYLSVIGQKVCT